MVQVQVPRSLVALVVILGSSAALASTVAAAPLPGGTAAGAPTLEAPAPHVHAEVGLPEAPAAVGAAPPVPVDGDDALAAALARHTLLEQGVLTRTTTIHLDGGLPMASVLTERSAYRDGGRIAGAGPADGAQGQEAEMVAAGTLAALGTFALKFEPLRRGLFLLALPLYSRLRRSELLDNKVRERIYRALESDPGLSIIQVCRSAKVGWGTAVYHLQRLERDRMIASRRDGQYRRFYLNGHVAQDAAPDPAGRVLAHPLAARIAAFVHANPGAAQKDVCTALAISPPLASKWLGRLLETGLLTSQREWKLVRYAPTPALAGALAAPPGAVVAAPQALPA